MYKEGCDIYIYHTKPAPLPAGGLNTYAGKHVKRVFPNGKDVFLSNFAYRQNLMRVLVSLSILTGNKKYQDAAKANYEYYFKNSQIPADKMPDGKIIKGMSSNKLFMIKK
jgi:hypothetical protein